ncbi:SpoIIE family protein phosphatase [Actinoplanes sp. NPDC051851]|uniref:SpoIIE family protein phosphatase n=1 Tax=Actinoplanes sp. NPDC051851 TaxID=3154753 RepID=UPI00341E5C99
MGAVPDRLRIAFERGGEMGARMAALDWSGSPAGDPSTWPPELVGAVITALASKTQIVIFWGPGHVVFYNDAYIPTPGAKHPAYLGRPGVELWAEAWDQISGLFDRVAEAGEAFYATDLLFLIDRYGFLEETYFDISYDPIRGADGAINGVMCIVTDTTGRVIGERRARTLSALGRRLAAAPDEAALVAEAAAVLGENPGDLPFSLLTLDPAGAHPAVREVIETGRESRVPLAELTAVPPTAAPEALVLPIGAGTDTVGALVAGVSCHLAPNDAYRDFLDLAAAQISRAVANARAYEQERERAAELAALDRAKTDFFSNVSHEFRTPLTLVLGPVEDMLADPGTGLALRDRLQPVHRNGLRLLKLVNTVLDFSRLESGRMGALYRPTELAGHTARLAATFRPAVERVALELVIAAAPSPVPVHVDHEMWEKIVFNLLSNAVKFTREGRIEVRVTAEDGHARLAVRDTGVGIAESEQAMLFDRFHRVTGAWSRSHEGTGIGLALVRELAELHGGTVSVTSVPGSGSEFTVRIPFGTGHLPADRVTDDPAPSAPGAESRLWADEVTWWAPGGEPAQTGAPGHAGGRILLADDNADLREHVSHLLRPYWEVVLAADGTRALELAREGSFDLVLTDVMMPGLDGFGLIAALRADERTREVPIVVLSARAGEEAAVEGLAAGADDYLVKPFSTRELVARVRANLELGQLRRQTVSRLRGLVDAMAALNAVPGTAEVLEVAARHVREMTSAGRVVVTSPDARAERDGGAEASAAPDLVLPLPDDEGRALGELRVWSGPGRPADPVVLTQLARLIGLRLANARLYETEHRIARTLQHSLLPSSLPRVPGAVVAGRYVAGSSEARVGGDWYDVIAGPDDQLYLVIGDVVGKGVHAAATMGQLRNALRAYIMEGFDCGPALSRLNRLVDTLGRRMFATVLCVRFDPGTRTVRWSAAGHPSPILVNPGERGTFLYTSALGPPIGALGDVSYPTRETRLAPGSRLLLYTDGLVEDRRQGIDAGLAELTADAATPTGHVDDLLDTLLAKAMREVRRDDIAMIALEVTEPREFTMRLPAEPGKLSVLRKRLEDFLAAHRVPEADVFDLIVAVSEAAANAIEHPVDPAEPVITVAGRLTGDAVVVTVRDTGSWRPATDAGFRGRGLALIGALTEFSVHRSPQGTEVTLRRPLSP